jgi:hypothetical protein
MMDIKKLTDDISINAYEEQSPELIKELLNALKEISNEDGTIDNFKLITTCSPIYAKHSIIASSKATLKILQSVFPEKFKD